MIAIQKGAAPLDLAAAGEKHARELCAAYKGDPQSYKNGACKMRIRSSIYATAKAELEKCHYGKCCYCETRIDDHKPYADSHIEHWRPQYSWRQAIGEKRMRPGYYWLAYDWDNLFLSCSECNRQKNDVFPLANPKSRATDHEMLIEDETPAILKPDGTEDPRAHIRFENEKPVSDTCLGKKTIEVLKLDSEAHAPRKRHFEELEKARRLAISFASSTVAKLREDAEDARQFVVDAVNADRPYSSMAADFLEKNPVQAIPHYMPAVGNE